MGSPADTPPDEPVPGEAGASALREYERRRRQREQHARETLGPLGGLLARVIDEPSSTKVWKQGADGERDTASRLDKHLAGTGVLLLHDRRIPRRGAANIDHLAVGPGGVTVIDSKTHRGKIQVDRVGGLFAPRRSVLLISGRDRTSLIDGVERQIAAVGSFLTQAGYDGIEIRAALCFPNVEGLPLFRQLSVRDVVIDGPKPVAKLAARPGPLGINVVNQIWVALGRSFSPA
jgi:hypothetical protein